MVEHMNRLFYPQGLFSIIYNCMIFSGKKASLVGLFSRTLGSLPEFSWVRMGTKGDTIEALKVD